MEIQTFGVMKSEIRNPNAERIPKSEILPPLGHARPVADASAGFLRVAGAA
jgi:hypothetical protein